VAEIGSGKSLGFKFFFYFQRFSEISRDFPRIGKSGFVETKRHFLVFPEIFRDFQRFFSVKTDLPFFHESKISENQWGHAIRRSCWISVVSWWTRTSPLLARRKKRGLGMTIKGGSRVLCGASRRKDASQRRPPSSNVEQVVGSYGACKRC
jgi:hypothetical protein